MVYMVPARDELGARQAVQPDPNVLQAMSAVNRVRRAAPRVQQPAPTPRPSAPPAMDMPQRRDQPATPQFTPPAVYTPPGGGGPSGVYGGPQAPPAPNIHVQPVASTPTIQRTAAAPARSTRDAYAGHGSEAAARAAYEAGRDQHGYGTFSDWLSSHYSQTTGGAGGWSLDGSDRMWAENPEYAAWVQKNYPEFWAQSGAQRQAEGARNWAQAKGPTEEFQRRNPGAVIIGGNGATGTGVGGGLAGAFRNPLQPTATDQGGGSPRDTPELRADPRHAGPGGGGGGGGSLDEMNALRRRIIQGTYDPRYEKEQEDLIRGARVDAPRAIAGTDLSGARGYAGRASGEVGNVQAGTVENIAGTDLDRARRALESFRGSIGDVRLTENHERVDNPLTFDPSAAAARARELTSGGLESLYSAPDRQQIAMETLRLAREEAEPQFRQRLRSVAQRAAALGRTRSGMTTNDLTGLEQDERQREDRLRRSVVNDAASQTMADRLARLSASQGVAGQFRGEDLAEAGFEQGLRQERRGERGFFAGLDSERAALAAQRAGLLDTVTGRETEQASIRRRDDETDREYRARQEQARAQAAAQRAGLLMNLGNQEADFAGITRRDAESDREMDFRVGSTNAGLNLDRARLLGGMDAQRFGIQSQLREELRGERGRGDFLAQQAIENERTRRMTEEGLLDSRTNRALRVSQAQQDAGSQRDQINALLSIIQRGGEGSQEAIQLLMQLYGQRRAQGG